MWAFGVLADLGDATQVEDPPTSDGPCELEVTWPTDEVDRIAETAASWGVTDEQLHHLDGNLVLTILYYLIWTNL